MLSPRRLTANMNGKIVRFKLYIGMYELFDLKVKNFFCIQDKKYISMYEIMKQVCTYAICIIVMLCLIKTVFRPKNPFICLCQRSLFLLALTCLRQHSYRGDGLSCSNLQRGNTYVNFPF